MCHLSVDVRFGDRVDEAIGVTIDILVVSYRLVFVAWLPFSDSIKTNTKYKYRNTERLSPLGDSRLARGSGSVCSRGPSPWISVVPLDARGQDELMETTLVANSVPTSAEDSSSLPCDFQFGSGFLGISLVVSLAMALA